MDENVSAPATSDVVPGPKADTSAEHEQTNVSSQSDSACCSSIAGSPARIRPVATAERLSPARSRLIGPNFPAAPTLAEIIAANATREFFPEPHGSPGSEEEVLMDAASSPQPAVDSGTNIGLAAPTPSQDELLRLAATTPSQEEILAMMDIMERAQTPTAIASAPSAPPPLVISPSDGDVMQAPDWAMVEAVFNYVDSSIREDIRAHRTMYNAFKAQSDKGNRDHCPHLMLMITARSSRAEEQPNKGAEWRQRGMVEAAGRSLRGRGQSGS